MPSNSATRKVIHLQPFQSKGPLGNVRNTFSSLVWHREWSLQMLKVLVAATSCHGVLKEECQDARPLAAQWKLWDESDRA